jgi:hypothetical protein
MASLSRHGQIPGLGKVSQYEFHKQGLIPGENSRAGELSALLVYGSLHALRSYATEVHLLSY